MTWLKNIHFSILKAQAPEWKEGLKLVTLRDHRLLGSNASTVAVDIRPR